MNIEELLNKATNDHNTKQKIKYKTLKSEELYDFISQYEKFPKRDFSDQNRDYVLATYDNRIIGFSIMADKSKFANSLQNVISLSNIEVHEDFRNLGVASNMIDLTIKEIKKQNKIMLRTLPDELGEKYIYNQITNKLKKENVCFIPHNLSHIYNMLEKKVFDKKNINNKDKIKLMLELANKTLEHTVCKKYNIENIEQ